MTNTNSVRKLLVCVLAIILLAAQGCHMSVMSNVTVSTITSSLNRKGENAPAVYVSLDSLTSVASARDGSEVYFTQASTIRKVRKDGTLETIAGTGDAGSNTNHGGKALLAQLNNPNFVIVDESNGDLYLSDKDNYLVRKIDTNGTIFDIAGLAGQSGIMDGNFSVATFSSVTSLAISNSGILVTDSNCLRLISLIFSNVTSLYCAGSANFLSVVASSQGDIYLSDGLTNTILKLNADMTSTTTIAGNGISGGFKDGNALDALFSNPFSMVLKESTQELFISSNNRIRKLNLQTQQVSTIVGGAAESYEAYTASNDGLNVYMLNSLGMSYNFLTNTLFIVDNGIFIRKVNLSTAGEPTTIIAGLMLRETVYGVSYDQSAFNGYYVGHSFKGDAIFQTSTTSIIQFKDKITSPVYIVPNVKDNIYPYSLRSAQDSVYFVDPRYCFHQHFYNGTHIDMTPNYFGIDNVPVSQAISNEQYSDIQFDKNGDVYLAVLYYIRKVSLKTGIISTIYSENSDRIISLLILDNGDIIFSTYDTIRMIISKNTSTILVGIPGRTDYNGAGLGVETTAYSPNGLSYNPLDGLLYYSDTDFNKIRSYNFTSKLVKTLNPDPGLNRDGPIENAPFSVPRSMAIDPNTGYLYIADMLSYTIRRIANGSVTTAAGIVGQSGSDDGPLLSATFRQPFYISTIDGDEFFIGDSSGIRRMSLSKGIIETLAPQGGIYGEGLPFSKDITTVSSLLSCIRKAPISGDLYYSDNYAITKVDNQTNIVSTITFKINDSEPTHYSRTHYTSTQFVLNSMGELIFYDIFFYKLRKIDRNGMVSTLAGSGFSYPHYTFTEGMKGIDMQIGSVQGLAYCATDNLIYWTDGDTSNFTRLNTDGTVSTVATNVGVSLLFCNKFGTLIGVEQDTIKVYSNNTFSTIVGQAGSGYTDGALDTAQLQNINTFSISQLDNSIIINENSVRLRKIGCTEESFEMQDDFKTCLRICYGKGLNACSGRGKCVAVDNCTCPQGWIGKECETVTCFGLNGSDACSGSTHGSCFLPNNCSCLSGWTGQQCETPVCYGLTGQSSCSSHGSCQSPNNCSCQNGWTGQQCETPICFGKIGMDACSGKGSCFAPNNCTCSTGYYDSDCSKFDCFGIEKSSSMVCSNGNGKCSSPNNCTCLSGWTGQLCESATCFGLYGSDACSKHGNCSLPNNCTCQNGWTGQQCALPICYGLTGSKACSGKGVCVSPNTCTCLSGFGQQCEISSSPSASPLSSKRVLNHSNVLSLPFISFLLIILSNLFML